MPQNYVNVRMRYAAQAAQGAEQVVNGVAAIEQAAQNVTAIRTLDAAAGSGTFLDSDFSTVPGLSHLSAALLSDLLGPILATLQTARDSHTDPADPASPTLGDVLRACQRGQG